MGYTEANPGTPLINDGSTVGAPAAVGSPQIVQKVHCHLVAKKWIGIELSDDWSLPLEGWVRTF